jgi:hypothetical protein
LIDRVILDDMVDSQRVGGIKFPRLYMSQYISNKVH